MAEKPAGRIDLPSVAEIEASTDILRDPTKVRQVVGVRERFAVKVGFLSYRWKQRTFVAANSKIAVPKVYDHLADLEMKKRYIIMYYVPGADVQKLSSSLTPVEKRIVGKRIR
jgi:hypothetical protein